MKNVFPLLPIMLALIIASCSSNADNEKVDYILTNTRWASSPFMDNHSYDPKSGDYLFHRFHTILAITPPLEYTIGKSEKTSKEDTLNLCKVHRHTSHLKYEISFSTDKCTLSENQFIIFRIRIPENYGRCYTFKEGSYTGTYYGDPVNLTVKKNGIYSTSVNGDTLVLPLDGYGRYDYFLPKEYSAEEEAIISSKTSTYSYYRDNDKILLYNKEQSLTGTLKEDGYILDIALDGHRVSFHKQNKSKY